MSRIIIIFKNGRVCRDIKTEKAQKQDCEWYLSNKIKHHFHITTLHKYSSLCFAFTLVIIRSNVFKVSSQS